MSAKDAPIAKPTTFPVQKLCGCWDEATTGMVFSLSAAKPMPPKSEFTDGAHYIRHYCDAHWEQRENR